MVVPAFLLSTGTRSKTVPALSLPQSPTEKDSSESATMPDAWNGPLAHLESFNPGTWAVGPGWYGSGPLALRNHRRTELCEHAGPYRTGASPTATERTARG